MLYQLQRPYKRVLLFEDDTNRKATVCKKIDVNFSQQGKGQRRSAAVHIVDAVILGGKDVRNLHYSER